MIHSTCVCQELSSRCYTDHALSSRGEGGPGGLQQQFSYSVDEYSFDFYFQGVIAGNYIISDVLSTELLEIQYLDQSRYNAKVS